MVGGDDNLYVFGGNKNKDVQMYNPKTSNWTMITTMPSNTIYEGCTVMPDDPFKVKLALIKLNMYHKTYMLLFLMFKCTIQKHLTGLRLQQCLQTQYMKDVH